MLRIKAEKIYIGSPNNLLEGEVIKNVEEEKLNEEGIDI